MTTDTAIAIPPSAELVKEKPSHSEQQSTSFLQKAQSFEILCDFDLEQAAEEQKAGKALLKEIDTFIGPMKQASYQAYKAIGDREKKLTEPLKQGVDVYAEKMGAYHAAQDAKKKAQLAAEGAVARQIAAEAAREGVEELAQQMEEGGNQEAAAAVRGTENYAVRQAVANVVIEPEKAFKPTGTMARENWVFNVDNPDLVPREYLMVDEVKIGRVVRAMKADTKIPGISVQNKPKLHAR